MITVSVRKLEQQGPGQTHAREEHGIELPVILRTMEASEGDESEETAGLSG